jgi:hypothetical protein
MIKNFIKINKGFSLMKSFHKLIKYIKNNNNPVKKIHKIKIWKN